MKKRPEKYAKKLTLQDNVGFDDLISLSLRTEQAKEKATEKKNNANRKRASGKKK